MVELITFFFGLTTGVQPVELAVSAPVSEVVVQLDGQTIAKLDGAPWVFPCDLGAVPAPRELVAIGRDRDGREVDRAVQWINLGVEGPEVAARMSFLEDDQGRRRAVSIAWERIGQTSPPAIEITFDGRPLRVERADHIELPPYEEGTFHFVSATLRFSERLVSRLDASFGGRYGEDLSTELTAVPIVVDAGVPQPPEEQLDDAFLVDGRPVRVHGVEHGPAELLVVRDPAAQPELDRLTSLVIPRRSARGSGRRPSGGASLGDDVELRVVLPFAAPVAAGGVVNAELFPRSARLPLADGGLATLLRRNPPPQFPVRLAEAVANAGMAAHASGRRRAVVLILGDGTTDSSRYPPSAARDYLRQLRVPLVVWSTVPLDGSQWGPTRFVGAPEESPHSPENLIDAVRSLREELERQSVVWLQGRHLPHRVELGREAQGLHQAGAM